MSAAVQSALLPDVLNARAIARILSDYHQPRDRWLFLTELQPGTGVSGGERRIDAWAMHCWPSDGYTRTAYEIKVSRSDFLAEIREPRKRRWGLLYSNLFYFVTPPGLLKIEEVPAECGLIEVGREFTRDRNIPLRKSGEWCLSYTLSAPHRDTPAPSWRFMASVTRQARDQAMRETTAPRKPSAAGGGA